MQSLHGLIYNPRALGEEEEKKNLHVMDENIVR